ncbi:hypothetical protein SLE2022_314640 [Rubroshorea leprosula]
MRVKTNDDRRKQDLRTSKVLKAADVHWTKVKINRLVQLGKSYAQAVVGVGIQGEFEVARPANEKEKSMENVEKTPE